MKTKDVKVHFNGRINMGDFESIEFGYGEVVSLDPGENVKEVREKAKKRVKAYFEEEADIVRTIATKRRKKLPANRGGID